MALLLIHTIFGSLSTKSFLSREESLTLQKLARFSPLLDLKGGAEWAIATYGLKEDPEEIVAEWKELSKSFFVNSVQLRPGVVDFY